ncbi:hypothetical protein [Heyndrickxia coagulans]|uniref:hypothetical protein n=1 Tax=Heyndrickxia coagulans TaxID=1398 RepID=UPI002E1E41B6|nr:hypothetical protein [Heyndrickxia coagulans]
MDIQPELVKLGTDLATIVGRNSVQAVFDKIRVAKNASNKDETIQNLSSIINDLINDKNELIRLAQIYEEKLITQKISSDEIEYITSSIIPILENFFKDSKDEDIIKAREALNMIKPILSNETFNIMQLLGFNFKQAIGEPLTKLVKEAISSKTPVSPEKTMEYQLLLEQRHIEFFKVLQDEKASKRFFELLDIEKEQENMS